MLESLPYVDDNHKAAQICELQRRKWLATGALVFCFVVMIVAKILDAHYPTYFVFGVVAAFAAEAATIGGTADWCAVVALLGRPLNLSLPHTDIVRSSQPRIADNLGRFLDENSLSCSASSRLTKQFGPACLAKAPSLNSCYRFWPNNPSA